MRTGKRLLVAAIVALAGTVAALVATRGLSPAARVDPIGEVQGAQGCPKWSPDGRRVLYATGFPGDRRVEVADVATGASHSIASGFDPAWSPGGRSVVFVRRPALMLVGVRGGHERRLVVVHGALHAPAWSPDGTTIAFAFTSRRDLRTRLAFVDARTGGLRVTRIYPVLDPVYSPTGHEIAYDTNDEVMVTDVHGGAGRILFQVDGVSATGPSWSPDGRKLVFAAQSIYVGEAATGDRTQLTHPDATADIADECPAWSPDGRRIAFLRSHSYSVGLETATESAIVLMRADGSHQRLLGGA